MILDIKGDFDAEGTRLISRFVERKHLIPARYYQTALDDGAPNEQ